MPWTSEEGQQIGRIEAKVDTVLERTTSHSRRLSALEVFTNRVKGVIAFIIFLGSIAGVYFVTGCASTNQFCSYYEDGMLKSVRTRSTVVGTGETEMVSDACAALAYSTRDTGLSDNGAEAIDKVAKAAANASAASAAASIGGAVIERVMNDGDEK